jgi:hypothetical protein
LVTWLLLFFKYIFNELHERIVKLLTKGPRRKAAKGKKRSGRVTRLLLTHNGHHSVLKLCTISHQEKVHELIVASQQTYDNWVLITSNLH